ncbi:MAG TPA: STAS domain-containing protein [Bradyrhizobium sp.]|nr:STAS domain-containing protein [Bradyrhizobium sp.]
MKYQESGDVGRLVLDGPLTLRTVEETHAKLLEMCACHASLDIDCSAADEVDLSFVQLILAARSSARAADRTIRLAHAASGALRDTLQRGGFLTDQAADQAFWLQPETV